MHDDVVPAQLNSHVILNWPKPLSLGAEVQPGSSARRSWIQLARTGSFVSNRYGKFSITKDDLSQMLRNFTEITPRSPTELPIDYDHLSMNPKVPGDGIAAGWMKKLELREDGNELWAEVEWTPDGAKRIENKEYRFVSPSFVKDHTHKDGKKIGTTLLAAAITNHPFLEGMEALTLYNFSALGDLALTAPDGVDAVNLGDRSKYPGGKYPGEQDGARLGKTGKSGTRARQARGRYSSKTASRVAREIKDEYSALLGGDDSHQIKDVRPSNSFGDIEIEFGSKLTRDQKDRFEEDIDEMWPEVRGLEYDQKGKVARLRLGDADLDDEDEMDFSAKHLSEVGQRVMIAPGNARTMDEVGGTFEITEVVGTGDDAFCQLKDASGAVHKWFRATELLPASNTPMPGAPPLQAGVPNPDKPVPGAPTHPETAAAIAQATELTPEEKEAALAAGKTEEEALAEKQAAAAAAIATGEPGVPGEEQPGALEKIGAPGEEKPLAPGEEKAVAEGEPDGEKPAFGAKKEAKDGGDAPDGEKKVEPEAGKLDKKVETQQKPSDTDDDSLTDQLKRAIGTLFGGPKAPKKGIANMTFKLRNDKNEEVAVTTEQLAAAGIQVVPEGSTVIGTKELSDLQTSVTSLSATVAELKSSNAAAAQAARVAELSSTLDRLSAGAFITKPTRDALFEQFKDAIDLSAFRALAATFKTPIVELAREHGSGQDATTPEGTAASNQLMELANTIVREKGISLRDALIEASGRLPQASETYRESFA